MKTLQGNHNLFSRLQHGLKILMLTFTLISLASCLDDKEKCSEDFTKTIVPIKIKGGKQLIFDIDDFGFVLDRNTVIEDITLEGELEDHNDNVEDFSFDINGIKAVRRDGGKHIELDRRHGCRYRTPVHKFFLNGGDSFHVFMLKLKLNKGQLVLNMHSKKNKIISASLVFKGKKYKKCDTPPPPPPPPPVAPNTVIDSANPTGETVASINMNFTFSSDQSGVTFWCKLDNGSPSTCVSPVSYSGLANGSHNFSVYAVNSSGLADPTPAVYSWTIDTVPPSVTIDNGPNLPLITNSTSVTFVFSSSEPGSFTCSLDEGASTPCTSPKTYSGLAEGAHNISINVVDNVGNASSNPATFSWSIDVTAPIASIVNVNPSTAVNNSTTVSVEFNASESSGFECSIDNNAYASCSSPLVLNSVAEGNHWFAVRATDVAGNIGLPATYSWSTDLTAPVVTITNTVPSQGLTNSHNVFAEFFISENASVNCVFDGAASSCSNSFNGSVDSEGTHTLEISASDLAGNVSSPVSLSWIMDFTNPVLSWGVITPSAAAFINSGNINLEVIPSEVVSFVTKLNGIDANQSSSPVSFSGLSEGLYTVEVTALDNAGNPSATISHSFTVDATAPLINVSSAVNGLTNLDSNTITFSVNENATFSCNIDLMGFVACTSPLALSGLANGDHNVEVKATDLAGNVSLVSSVSWSIDTIAPATSISAQQNSRNNFTFSLSSSESNSTFICSIDSATFTACSDQFNQTFADGPHTVVGKAVDAAGNADAVGASYNLIALPPIDTVLNSASANGLTNSVSQNINFSSNYANASYQCSLDGGAFAACSSPVNYVVGEGAHSFVVFAVDPWNEADATPVTVNWLVDVTPPHTSLTTRQNTNNNFTFNFTSNEAGSTFQCSIDEGSYQACASALTITVSQGNHTISVRAIDAAGNVDTEGASAIFIATPPISTSINSVQFLNLTKFNTQTISFSSNTAGATFVCQLDNGTPAPCTSPKGYSGLSDGTHTFVVKAVAPWGQADNVGAAVIWAVDTVAPVVSNFAATATSTTITASWTTNEMATSSLLWGLTPNANNTLPDDGVLKTSHSNVRITGLSPFTFYTIKATGHDQAGNQYVGPSLNIRTAR
ncbi:MAG: hypothetical protein A4S09_12010 [Proteobacteria bacterium SG_bin7]|nr:MAG: hypothetical protein A4S09_12010 [Proteobacteria bacterium SG_bin7]